MFCPNCGNEIKSGANFCNGCGHHIEARDDEVIEPIEIEAEELPAKESSNKKHTGLIVLLVALFAILIGLVVALFVTENPQPQNESTTAPPVEDAAELSDEDIITNGYWFSDELGEVLFKPIENNETFDGIMVFTGWEYIFPYIVDEDEKVNVYFSGYQYNEDTDSKDAVHELLYEINIVEDAETGNKNIEIEEDGEVVSMENVLPSAESEILLKFSMWADYDYSTESVDDFYDHQFLYLITEEAQRDVHFYDFYKRYTDSEDYNMSIFKDIYGSEDWNAEESWDANYTVDDENNCVYIDDDKYQFFDDGAFLYCEETDHTIYRITDYALGKVADADFPPGEFTDME